jgi:hypothetical protein
LFTDELPPGLPVSRGEFDHKIKLIDDRKTSVGYTVRLSTLEQDQLKVMIDDMLKKGFLSPSSSPFGAPCFFVKKPHDQGLRLVVDWRNLNANTVKDKTQLPNIIDLLSLLHRARYFSILDGHSGFWQILLRPEDREKTAFRTPFGNYEWNVMGMGLTNAPATYQRLMNHIFKPFLRDFVAVYLDDVLVYSVTLNDHVRHLRAVFEVLKANKIRCKPSKCTLASQSVTYLGHVIGFGTIRVDPEKISKIVNMPAPKSKGEVSTFLGMCSYLAAHIVHYAELAMPLTQLTHHDVEFSWTADCQQSFDLLKKIIVSDPV